MIRLPRRTAIGLLLVASASTTGCGDETAGPAADTVAPVVRIASPADGAVFTSAVACSAAASDDRGVVAVEFRVHPLGPGGLLQADSVVAASGALPSPPYAWSWSTQPVPNGGYAIVCEASDAAGNAARDTVRVELQGDRWAPQVAVAYPFDNAVVKGVVPVIVEATDDSPVDSVWVTVRSGDDGIVEDSLFTSAPYAFSWDTRLLPQGAYRICARARDRAGNASVPACNGVRSYPRAVLRFDDGTAESGRGDPNYTWQMAVVFQNPYDVPVVVDTIFVFIHASSPLGAPFRFVLWHVSDGRPTTEVQGTPQLAVRNPRNTWGYYPGWSTIVPAGGSIAAGWQQTGTEATVLGMDDTSPFHDGTFFFTFPARAEVWGTFESLGYDGVPMIRLHVSAFTGRLPLPHAAKEAAYGTLDDDGVRRRPTGGWLAAPPEPASRR